MRRACRLLGFAGLVAGLVACGGDGPAELSFRKRIIDPAYRSEGVTVFDVDRDGWLDLVTEELWYAGPDFAPRELREPRTWDPLTSYASGFGAFHMDVDGDRHEDLIVFHFPGTDATWCQNPAGEDRHWACHQLATDVFGESPLITTSFGDRTSLVVGAGNPRVLGWMAPGAQPELPWIMHPLTPAGFPQAGTFGHGLGLGDLDGDGRLDLITGVGWFRQPIDPAAPEWPFYPVAFCPDNCSHMFAHDLDGDGLTDVIGASPHGYGAWWWRQTPGADAPGFVQHEIDPTNSQNHAARFVDLDGDGVPELVTGKRYWAHFDQDAGAHDPVVLIVYRHRREAGAVVWDRIVVDDDSGVGSHQLEVVDVDGDGKLDIVTSTKKGLFLFQRD